MPEADAIVVERLARRFGSVVALAGIDLTVPAGSVFGLLGPNGAGKTTAIRVLATILAPDGGRASVMGHDVVREPMAVRSVIGLAGQYAAVDVNLTGRENLRMIGRLTQLPAARIRPRAQALLEQFDLVDAADRPVRTYSGGMRRRLDLAAALVHEPPVLFLDEPTTGLDPFSRTALWEMIRELVAAGTTVLLTTQYLEEADRLAGRIAVIDRGRVIADGTPAELKAGLGSTVLEIGMADRAVALRADSLLDGLAAGRRELVDAMLRVTTHDGTATLMEVLRRLDQGGLVPTRLAVREPSLDDVFLALTGRRTEPEPEPAAERAAG